MKYFTVSPHLILCCWIGPSSFIERMVSMFWCIHLAIDVSVYCREVQLKWFYDIRISTSVVVDDDHFWGENHSYSLLSNSLEKLYSEEAVQYWISDLCIFHLRVYAGGWESVMESFAQILYLLVNYSTLDHQKMLKLWKWCLGNIEPRTPQIWEK